MYGRHRGRIILCCVALGVAVVPAGAAAQAPDEPEPPSCLGQVATIVGTAGDDVLTGTDGSDVIVALGGDDRIDAGAGDDLVCSGADALVAGDADRDVVLGGDGDDTVRPGPGDDRVEAGPGRDNVEAGDGNDSVVGGDGDDYLLGQAGSDTVDGGAGRDYLEGNDGIDLLLAGGGEDSLAGGAGNDRLTGAAATGYLDGGDGDDTLSSPSGVIIGGDGADVATGRGTVAYTEGGGGDDTIAGPGYLAGGPGADALTATVGGQYLDGGDGPDRLQARGASTYLHGGDGDDTLEGAGDVEVLEAGDGDDELAGGGGADRLDGGPGDDRLRAGPGSDVLLGGEGADDLNGGPDPDEFYGDGGSDVLRAVDDGPDTTFACGATFEDDRLIVDATADAAAERINCDHELPRTYSPPPPPPARGAWYVALGDSYSSGEGTYTYGPELFADDCHRGPLAWPRMLRAQHLGVSIDHRACSGATTTYLRNPWSARFQDAQIHDQVQTRTELVTLTVGGNDVGFAGLVANMRASVKDTPPSPAFRRAATERRLRADLHVLEATLRVVYRRMRAIYPNARLVHVGYPAIVPDLGDPAPRRCAWLGKKEQSLAEWLGDELNGTIRRAAEASTANVEFVDVADILDGHELCTDDSWMVDLALEQDDVLAGGGTTERGHPTIDGQNAYADRVAQALGY